MIIDRLENAHLYYCLGQRFETGLRFLQDNWDTIADFENGVLEIDGRDVFLVMRRYDTVKLADAKTEAHKKARGYPDPERGPGAFWLPAIVGSGKNARGLPGA